MKHRPATKLAKFLHGADYNPEQWQKTKEIWKEDMRMMKLSHSNVMSVGIFSWSFFEPEEGRYDFTLMDEIIDMMYDNGVYAIIATPSGARPPWLAQKYPEVLRVDESRRRQIYGDRHNHCMTSPVYREKTAAINRALATRYKDHPGLILWHVSNEINGECHCPLCQKAFQDWLRVKYHNDLDELNEAWWTGFWSHRFTDFSQIESNSPIGDGSIHGLLLDWKRFVTDQTCSFFDNETAPLREVTPNVPICANLMAAYGGLDYKKLAEHMDVVSHDSYPRWFGREKDYDMAINIGFLHDLMRCLKNKPFLLMESTPSLVNWQAVNGLKRPRVHRMASLQAVAHGSDSVQYFQWRKSRGAYEKLHGAVVDHCGHEHTRVFNDVKEVGEILSGLDEVLGCGVLADCAIIYDYENRWAIKEKAGLKNNRFDHTDDCIKFYTVLTEMGLNVDVITQEADFSGYKAVFAPTMYMVKPNTVERIDSYVENGGHFAMTYFSGIVDENDLCFLGGFPGGKLSEIFGIWNEEIDSLEDGVTNDVKLFIDGSENKTQATDYCELMHIKTAEVIGTYETDFYSGMTAASMNKYGKGKAYYLGFRTDAEGLSPFIRKVLKDAGVSEFSIEKDGKRSVTLKRRTDGETEYIFASNFTNQRVEIELNGEYMELISKISVNGRIVFEAFDSKIFKCVTI